MGLADTIENVAPVSTDHSPNYANVAPPQHPQTQSNYNYQPNSNPPSSYPNYGHAPPAYVPNGQAWYGSGYNSSGSVNGSGIQKNGDAKIGNHSKKTGGVNIKSIGSNLDNLRGQQVQGDVKVGNIGG